MNDLSLLVKEREVRGSNSNGRMRKAGRVPAVVYGGNLAPLAIEVEQRTMEGLLRQGGENAIFLLKMEGSKQTRHAMIRDLQIAPTTGKLVHIDFQRVLMDQKVRVRVPVELIGTAVGVKTDGGVLDFVTREVEVECLPGDIPEHVSFDVTDLRVGQHIEVAQLSVPSSVTVLDDGNRVIASISRAKTEGTEEGTDEQWLEAEPAQPERVGKDGKDKATE